MWYPKICSYFSRFSWLAGDPSKLRSKAELRYGDCLEFFLEHGIQMHEPLMLAKSALMLGLFGSILAGWIGILAGIGIQAGMSILVGGIFISIAIWSYLAEYPRLYISRIRSRELGDLPEMMSYLVMALKLNPNLEDAFRFASENSGGPLGKLFRKCLWKLQLGEYPNLTQAISELGSRWKAEHGFRSLLLAASSVDEPSDIQRELTLNRSLEITIHGTQDMMEEFGSKLHQPSLVFFSIFVMIPLALVAMLPAAAVAGFRLGILEIAVMYNLVFPLAGLGYSEWILSKRPWIWAGSTRSEFSINIRSLIVAAICIIISEVACSAFGINPGLGLIWGGMGFGIYLAIHLQSKLRSKRELESLEAELPLGMMILGRRISEGRSLEESLRYASQQLAGTRISGLLDRISTQILISGKTLDRILFNGSGEISKLGSPRLEAGFKLLIQAASKDPKQAGGIILKLADHLRQLQDLENRIRRTLATITSSMKSTAGIFAPLIGGITLALAQIINQLSLGFSPALTQLGASIPGSQFIPMELFGMVMGIYLIWLMIILVRFLNLVEHGGDKLEFWNGLAKTFISTGLVFGFSYLSSLWFFQGLI